MKKWLVAILFGTVLTLGACGGGDDGADDNASPDGETVDTAAGEEVYKSSCASCHGGDLTGQSGPALDRSEEHTSELQSRGHLVCRLLLEKKKKSKNARKG